MIKVILDKRLKCFLKRVWGDLYKSVVITLAFSLVCMVLTAVYFGAAHLIYNMTEKYIGDAAIPASVFGPAFLTLIVYLIYEYIKNTWNKCK